MSTLNFYSKLRHKILVTAVFCVLLTGVLCPPAIAQGKKLVPAFNTESKTWLWVPQEAIDQSSVLKPPKVTVHSSATEEILLIWADCVDATQLEVLLADFPDCCSPTIIDSESECVLDAVVECDAMTKDDLILLGGRGGFIWGTKNVIIDIPIKDN